MDHPVANLQEAVKLAEQWQRAGTHKWFRGQSAVWNISSSLGRCHGKPADLECAHDRINHFCNWIKGVPELRHLLEEHHVHAFFAVLQHYGVPTHYVDFTVNPVVAGYFAGTGTNAIPGKEGCIIAIDPDAWVRSLRAVAQVKGWPKDRWPEKVEVSVPNLWRMQAQSGHFMYLPIEKPEGYYSVDRIVFRHQDAPIPLSRDDVYPPRKSPLELLLDEFFTEERIRSGNKAINAVLEAWVKAGQKVYTVPFERAEPAASLRFGARPHASWESVPEGWSAYAAELLSHVRRGTRVTLSIDPEQPMQALPALREGVLRHLGEHAGARQEAIDWKVSPTKPGTPPGWTRRAESAAARAWDGARRQPFTDQQLAEVVSMTLVLACARVEEAPFYVPDDFEPLLGPSIEVVLASVRDTPSRAVMSMSTFVASLRPDLDDVLLPELHGRPREQLLPALPHPRYLFHFDLLADAFARELIPTQVLLQADNSAVYFSPTATPVISLP